MPSQSQVKAGHAYILVEALDKTSAVFTGITRKLDGLSQRFLFAAKQAAILGAALSIPLITSVNAARDFSDEVLFLQSVLGATDEQMSPLIGKIKELGRTTSFTAKEVATAATALAQGGFTIDKITSSLKATLDMARGARMNLGEAANILVDTLTLFSMRADQAAEVADKFFIAAREGTIDVADLAQSFSYTALSAHEMGFNLEETLGILSEMSKRMLKATKAGTSLNQFITSLASNIEKVRDKGMIGIEVFEGGEPRPALEILKDFSEALADMPTEKKIPIIEEIFNVRGARAATAIAASIEGIFKTTGEMTDSFGVAAAASEKMDSGIGGSIRRILSAFNTLQIEIGLAMESVFQDVEDRIVPVIRGMSIWTQTNQDAIRDAAKAVIGIIGFGVALTTLGISARVAAMALIGLSNIITVLTLPVRLLHRVTGLLLGTTLKLARVGFSAVLNSLRLIAKLLVAPIFLIRDLAKAIINVTAAAINFSINLVSMTVKSIRTFVLTITGAIGAVFRFADSISTAMLRVFDLSVTIATALGGSLVRIGVMIEGFGTMLLNATAVWVMGISNTFTLLTTHVVGLLIGSIGVITALLGQAIVFAGPILALTAIAAALYAVFATIKAGIGFGRDLGNMLNKITEASARITVSIANLVGTTVRFVKFLVTNSLPSLQEFIRNTFGTIVSSGKRMWDDLIFVVDTSMATIKNLISAGDMDGAWKVIMRSMKFLWESTVAEMEIVWKSFTTEGKILFQNLMMEANIAFLKFRTQFKTAINEIYIELQNITNAIMEVFGVLYRAMASTAKFLSPAAAAMVTAIGDLLGQLSEESKNLFLEIRKSQELDAALRRRTGPSPEELKLDQQINALRAAQSIADEVARLALEEQIKRLEAAKEALRIAYEKDIVAAGTMPFIVEGGDMGKEAADAAAKRAAMPPDFAAAMADLTKMNTELPGALDRSSVEAHQKAYANREINLLSRMVGLLDSIDKKTEKSKAEDILAGIPPGAIPSFVAVGPP